MKEIRITHNQVLANLDRFRNFLRERHTSRAKRKERSYPVWIDRETGIMEFDKEEGAVVKNKKQLRLIVQEKETGIVEFEIKGGVKGVDREIQKIAEETLRILNLLSIITTRALPEERMLQDLSHVHLEAWKDRVELFPGWCGECGRIDAENMLRGKPIGSYVMRKADEVAEKMLAQYTIRVKGCILTVVECEQKISDYLILKTERGWALLNDDPDLTRYAFCRTLHELFERLKNTAVMPYIR